MRDNEEIIKRRHNVILGLTLDHGIPGSEVGKNLAHSDAFLKNGSVDDLPREWLDQVASIGEKAEKTLLSCNRMHISMVFLGDPDYPKLLENIMDPPALLFFRGRRELMNVDSVAVVGARRATAYGRKCAYEFAQQAARHGWNVISGLAVGVDTAAHLGALAQRGSTVAVMASSLEHCYPKSNERLFDQLASEGLLLSEYPPGTALQRWQFVQRNRIVSGMSKAVIVAQAGVSSGSLITARYAAEQGRDVYCVPGSIYEPEYLGSHRLIQDGANILYDMEMLFEEGMLSDQSQLMIPGSRMDHFEQRAGSGSETAAVKRTGQLRFHKEENRKKAGEYLWLYEVIDDFGISAEKLTEITGRDPQTVQQGLTMLELGGLLERNGSIVIRK